MIVHLDRGSQYLIEGLPGALWEARHRLIRRPGRLVPRQQPGGILTGQSSSESSSAVPTSRPEPRPSTPSVPGSRTTTPPGDTARSGTFRRSSGSCAIVSKPWTPHNHVSGRRGEGHAERGRRVVVILDKAHVCSPEQIKAVCLSMDAEHYWSYSVAPFSLGAFGAFDRRIALRCHIQGITATETNAYASHRLGLAGRPDLLFSDDVIALVHQVGRRLASACRDCHRAASTA